MNDGTESGRFTEQHTDPETHRLATDALARLERYCLTMINGREFGETVLTYRWEKGQIVWTEVNNKVRDKRLS